MKKGEIAQGIISETAYPDKGLIYRDDGRVLIKHAVPGQNVEYMISKKRNGQAEGRILNIIGRSALEDMENPCIHSGECGGCLYQSVSYENQLKIKEAQMKKLIDEAYGREYIWEGIEASPEYRAYRNKMEFSFGDEFMGGPLALGMHKRGGHYDIVSTYDCNIVHKDCTVVLKLTLEFFSERNIPFFHKTRHEGFLRHLVIRRSAESGELLVDLITTDGFGFIDDPNMKAANERDCSVGESDDVYRLINEWSGFVLDNKYRLEGGIAGILHTRNNSYADAVIDQGTRVLYGNGYITEKLLGLSFKITPFSFFQTNSKGAEILYSKAGEYIGDTKGKTVYDLYSGTGTIAQLLASYADKVVGVEIVEEAVEAAIENAAQNGLKNCSFIAGDVLKVIDELENKPDILILDPPRDGIHPKALPKLIAYGTEKIVYISCKPSSFARDLAVFMESGYRLERACAVDMFPFTANVETIALLSKLNVDKHISVEIETDELNLTGAEKN